MKKFKKILAILLVASMIFTTNAVNVFAEGMNANQEETTVGAKLGEPEEETTVGTELGEPEEDIDENLSEPENDTRRGGGRTLVGARSRRRRNRSRARRRS